MLLWIWMDGSKPDPTSSGVLEVSVFFLHTTELTKGTKYTFLQIISSFPSTCPLSIQESNGPENFQINSINKNFEMTADLDVRTIFISKLPSH